MGDEAVGQPARFGERWQQQRIGPQHETCRQARHRAVARAALPEQAADHHRRELRHRGEGNQADRDQCIGFAGDAEIEIAETEDDDDGPAPDFQQQTGEVRACRQAEDRQAQQSRHDQVVADHGRQGDGLDNHHAGRRRQAADIYEQRQTLLLAGHRQSQHEGVGIDPGALKMQHAGQRHRQHEEVDQEQVERKHPHRTAQMALVDVFHHGDLELARQQQRGEQREKDQGAPGAIGSRRVGGGETARDVRHRRRPGKNVADAVVNAPDHEDAHRQEGRELDHGFDGDCRHHAFVALGGVEVARAEEDGKRGQDHRHVKRTVLEDRHGAGAGRHDDFRVTGENRETVGYRLELEGDVGNHADHGDHRDQSAEQLTLAIARSDEVGDRSNSIDLGHPDHLVQDESGQSEQQGRAEVNRQEADAAGRRAANAAVEGPGRAIHPQRERIHHRIGNQRASGIGTMIGIPGDGKQEAQIQKRGEDDDPALQHLSPSCFRRPRPFARSAPARIPSARHTAAAYRKNRRRG